MGLLKKKLAFSQKDRRKKWRLLFVPFFGPNICCFWGYCRTPNALCFKNFCVVENPRAHDSLNWQRQKEVQKQTEIFLKFRCSNPSSWRSERRRCFNVRTYVDICIYTSRAYVNATQWSQREQEELKIRASVIEPNGKIYFHFDTFILWM